MTTKPNTRNAAKPYSHTHSRLNLRRKAIYVAVASCFSVTPAFAATNLANYNYATQAGMVTSDTMVGNTRTIANINKAILNWNGGLNIGTGETLRFQQVNAASSVLNRIGGGNATTILGTLSSNGKVFLINNAGIVFGQGSRVDVGGGLVASSLNITDSDFINGKNRFNADVVKPGSVINAGAITTPNGGFVYLISPQVENSGVINTPSGEAILAAGNSVELVDSADPSLRVVVRAKSQDVNLSQLMTQSSGQIFSVLNSGKISANSAVVGKNGKIQLRSAGNVQTTASSVLEAKGTTSTDGGLIRGFADGTGTYAGSFNVSGRNGGNIETSAAYLHLDPNISIAAQALIPGGHAGSWLLDPYDFSIGASEASTISMVLGGGIDVTVDTGINPNYGFYGTSGHGNITVNSAINSAYSGNVNLYLTADGQVTLNAPITNSAGQLSVNITADRDHTVDGGIAFNSIINVGGNVNAASYSGNITMSGTNSVIQASNVTLDTQNANIGTATSYIKTKTNNLTVGHFGGINPVKNAYIADAAAVYSARLIADTSNGVASLFLTGGLLDNSRIGLYGATDAATSSTGLTMNGGHITFYGGGVGTVAVNGDLNMASGAFIGNDSVYDGGTVKVSAANLTMSNSIIEGGNYYNDNGDVIVHVNGNLSMTDSHISTQNGQGSLDVEAGHITMTSSSSIDNGSGNAYAGDILIVAGVLDVLNGSSIGGYNPQGDTVIFAHDVNVSGFEFIDDSYNYSSIYGYNVGINYDPAGISSLSDVKNLPALDTFFKTATVTVSYGGGIEAGHGLGIVTGNLTVTTSDGNGNDEYASMFAGGSMALFTAGDLSIKGGTHANASVYVGNELFLKIGGKLALNSSSDGTGAALIAVDSVNTLFMDFPFVKADGWSVDGVNNAFTSSINPLTGIIVRSSPAVIGTNTFINYGDGITGSVIGAIKSFQASELLKSTSTNTNNTNTASTSDAIFGNEEEDDGKGGKNKKSPPKQCS